MRTTTFTLLLLATCLPHPAYAATNGGGTPAPLRVQHGTLNITQERAEYCLDFNHELESTAWGQAKLRLVHEPTKRSISTALASATIIDRKLCLPALDYRTRYRLSLSGIVGKDGQAMASPYHTDITVPARQASLSIAGKGDPYGWRSWDSPTLTLRSINISKVAVELYRLTSDADSLEAWRNRSQALYAPQEGAYFVREKGQVVWHGTVNVPMKNDTTQENEITLPLPAEQDQAGLYFVMVKAIDEETDPKAVDSSSPSPLTDLNPVAGSWLLRSDLRVRPISTPDGISLLAVLHSKGAPVPQLSVRLYDHRMKQVADVVTDAGGQASIPSSLLTAGETYSLLASTTTGDRLVQDIIYRPAMDLLLPRMGVTMRIPSMVVPPDQPLSITLDSRTGAITDSHLVITHPDGRVISTLAVPTVNKPTAVTLATPALTGQYTLRWLSQQGHILAHDTVRISTHPAAPTISLTPTTGSWTPEKPLSLTLDTRDIMGKPAPYRSGHITLEWRNNTTPFATWRDYTFGVPDALSKVAPAALSTRVGFTTDATGRQKMTVHPTPPLPAETPPETPLEMVVSAQGDAGQDLLPPTPVIVPLAPHGTLVGIKPQAPQARFMENSIARFSVIAVNSDGRAVAADNYTAHIFAEERSFDWHITSQGWDYRALPAARRLGKHAVTFHADRPTQVEWPVTSGLYRLDIMDDQKRLVARQTFSAGIPRPHATEPNRDRTRITPPTTPPRHGHAFTVTLPNTEGGTASLIIADDRLRLHRTITTTAPTTEITVQPAEDWGSTLRLMVDDSDRNRLYEATLTLDQSDTVKKSADHRRDGGDQLAQPGGDDAVIPVVTPSLRTLYAGDHLVLDLPLRNKGERTLTALYDLVAQGSIKLGHATGTVNLPAHGTGTVSLPLHALAAGHATITVTLRPAPKAREQIITFALDIRPKPVDAAVADTSAPTASTTVLAPIITRRYQTIGGKDVNPAALQQGKTYMAQLSFDKVPAEGIPDLTLTETTAAGLQPLGCPLPPTVAAAGTAAPPSMVITTCQLHGQTLTITGTLPSGTARPVLSYLVTAAHKGSFTDPALTARTTTAPIPLRMATEKIGVK